MLSHALYVVALIMCCTCGCVAATSSNGTRTAVLYRAIPNTQLKLVSGAVSVGSLDDWKARKERMSAALDALLERVQMATGSLDESVQMCADSKREAERALGETRQLKDEVRIISADVTNARVKYGMKTVRVAAAAVSECKRACVTVQRAVSKLRTTSVTSKQHADAAKKAWQETADGAKRAEKYAHDAEISASGVERVVEAANVAVNVARKAAKLALKAEDAAVANKRATEAMLGANEGEPEGDEAQHLTVMMKEMLSTIDGFRAGSTIHPHPLTTAITTTTTTAAAAFSTPFTTSSQTTNMASAAGPATPHAEPPKFISTHLPKFVRNIHHNAQSSPDVSALSVGTPLLLFLLAAVSILFASGL